MTLKLSKPEFASFLMYGGNQEVSWHLMITAKKDYLNFFGTQTCVIAKDEKKPSDLTIVSDSKVFVNAIKQWAKDVEKPFFIKFT